MKFVVVLGMMSFSVFTQEQPVVEVKEEVEKEAVEKPATIKVLTKEVVTGPEQPVEYEKGVFKYVSLGFNKANWIADEYDRTYNVKEDTYNSATVNIGFKDYFDVTGHVNVDKDSKKVRDFMGQLGFENWVFRYETGKIQGTVDDEDGPDGNATYGSFDNDYKLAMLYQKKGDGQGFRIGFTYINYFMPALIEVNDGDDFGKHVQDYKMEFTSIGLGMVLDPIMKDHRRMFKGEYVKPIDWYFAYFGLIIGFVNGKSNTITDNQVNGKAIDESWKGMGQSTHYELGYRYLQKVSDYSISAKVGYYLRAHWYMFGDSFKEIEDKEFGEAIAPTTIHLIHGLTFSFSMGF